MTPTEQLKEEHQAIKLRLSILESICQKLEAGQEVNPEHLDQSLEFIRLFADKCHHGKEEDALFPAMEAAGIPKEGGPIGVMLLEHDAGRGYVQGLGEAVARYKAGDRQAAPAIVENARHYIALLTQHILKEDNILYPMADMRLSPARQAKMLEEFDVIERERIGPGQHEEFHRMLEHLQGVYL
jgi:hemerythrin-like domain-containing protein